MPEGGINMYCSIYTSAVIFIVQNAQGRARYMYTVVKKY